MSVEVRGNRVTIRYRDAAGKHVRETVGSKGQITVAQARAVERDRVRKARAGWVKPQDITFTRLADDWFETTSRQKQWAPRTERAYRRSLKRLRKFTDMNVTDIRRSDLQDFADEAMAAGYSAKTVNFDMSTIHAVLEHGVQRELLETNVAVRAPRPRIRKKTWRILKPQEVRQVEMAFQDDQARLIFKTLVRTGLRRGEIRSLKVRDIDFTRKALRVVESKTDEGERWMALSPGLCAELRAWCLDKTRDELVFTSLTGHQFNPDWYSGLFREALLACGIIDYVRPFHDMRHTSLTNEAATAQTNPLALMARAGHRSMDTTRQYLKLAGVLFPDQAEALDRLYEETK